MLRDSWLIAAKDLRVELRSRVSLNQVLPFAVLVLMLFAFAIDPDRGLLARVTPGLFWVAVLLSALLALQRSFTVEAAPGVIDRLRNSKLDPAAIFLGKTTALAIQLLILEGLLCAGVVVMYDTELQSAALLMLTCAIATVGLAAAGTLYGALTMGLHVRETLLPLLVLPVVAPVLLAATRAWESGIAGATSEAWPWVQLLGAFALIYLSFGAIAFGALLEEA